jgi:hypothetical protein
MAAPLFRRAHEYAHALAIDLLSGADLCSLAALRLTIDNDRTGRDQLFALPAAVGNAGQLQQVAQAHVIVAQSEFTGFQEQAAFS